MNLSTASLIGIGISVLFFIAGFATLNDSLLIIGIAGFIVFGLIRAGFEGTPKPKYIPLLQCNNCGQLFPETDDVCPNCGQHR